MPDMFNGTVASITLRATMGRKRAFLFAIPPLILLLITVAAEGRRPRERDVAGPILGRLRLLRGAPAHRADHRHQRARRGDRRRQHRAPAGHAGAPVDGDRDQVRRGGRADDGLRGGARADRRADRQRRREQAGDRRCSSARWPGRSSTTRCSSCSPCSPPGRSPSGLLYVLIWGACWATSSAAPGCCRSGSTRWAWRTRSRTTRR